MLREAEAVVVGAGALGASVAFHLARAGWRNVVLVDRHDLASQTSPRAAGLSARLRSSALMTAIAVRGVEKIERFARETGEPMVYHRSGSLKIARTPAHEAQLRDEVALGRTLGVEVDFVSPAEARRLMPFLEDAGVRAITYSPGDVYLEPGQVPRGYARAAERLGATLMPRTAVTGVAVEDGVVRGVETDGGAIRTPVVVDAAGGWARSVAALAGLRVPMVPTRHQLFITEPIAGVADGQPITRVVDANVYVRPCDGGLMLGGYEPDPLQYDGRDLPDGGIDAVPLDLGVLRRLAASVAEQFPVFRDAPVRELRGGLPTMTPDDEHVVGPVPGARGFYVAGGCNVGGLSTAPAIGELLAAWITDGAPPIDLSPLSPARFRSGEPDEAELRAACRHHYARHYWAERSGPVAGHGDRPGA